MSSLTVQDIKVSHKEVAVCKDQIDHLPPLYKAFALLLLKDGDLTLVDEGFEHIPQDVAEVA